MSDTKTLKIPNGMSGGSMKKADTLYIEVDADCNWCYTMDPSDTFSSMLPAGSYSVTTPHTTYGPYTAENPGTLTFNAVTSGDCSTSGITAAVHSIIVSS